MSRQIDVIKSGLEKLPLEGILPPNISMAKFKNAVITACNTTPDLLAADMQSLFIACMKAAADGLIPDNRQAAFVIHNTKKGDAWVKSVQYMPMVAGIIQRMYENTDVASVRSHVVYERDKFTYVLGDDERFEHEPYLDGEPGEIKGAYAIVKFKDGSTVREFMRKVDIDKARASSKSADGPAWKNWYSEMARKCVIHRVQKYVPLSNEVAAFITRAVSEEDTTIEAEATEVKSLSAPTITSTNKLDSFESQADDMMVV